MQSERAKAHLEALDQARKIWQEHPDGANFRRLAEEFSFLVGSVIEEARNGKQTAVFSAPLPLSGERIRILVHFHRDGQKTIEHHHHARDFDDVIQDFQLHTLERYLRNPDFRITDPAFIRMGLALRAHSMERALRREHLRQMESELAQSQRESEDGLLYEASAHGEEENEERFLATLKTLWFHPFESGIGDFPIKEALGLSLRYLYTTLRVHSGASLQEIGRELNIHPSRFTHLKKELKDLLPLSFSGDWLPLGDFVPFKCSGEVLVKLDLIGVHSRFGLIREAGDERVRRNILKRKKALWEVYVWAGDQLKAQGERECGVFERIVTNQNREPALKLEVRMFEKECELLRMVFL